MSIPFFAAPIQVQSSRICSSKSLPSSRTCPSSCLNTRKRTRSNHRQFAPQSDQNKAQLLGRELLESGVLLEEDLKLFETFTDSRAELFVRVLNNRTRHITFVLDGVHGAHNLAAIARSCDAWSVQNLHLIAQPGREFSGSKKQGEGKRYTSLLDRFEQEQSVQNVSKNSHKWLTIKEHDGVESCVQELKSSGYKILVSSLSPSAKSIQQIDVSAKCAFVFGNESQGVSKEMEAQADELFTIPMMGFVESMNVSVAVATTACLTVTNTKAIVPAKDYALSIDQKRELVHIWLTNRFSSKGKPKAFVSSNEVTRLGQRCERRILENGMFQHLDEHQSDPRNIETLTMRLSDDTGARLATYVSKRKFGALGDGRFEKRCGTITYCLAGAHALSCGAVLARYKSPRISKTELCRYFTKVCDRVTDLYAPYFDSSGNPILPTFAPESQETFDRLSWQARDEAIPVCFEVAQNFLGLDNATVRALIERASFLDLSRCVTDTLRWPATISDKIASKALESLPKLPDLMQVLQARESVRILTSSFLDETRAEGEHKELPETWLLGLQIFLRLSHIAFLSSEIHQAVWDRSTTRNHLPRVHSLRFGLLESVLYEAWAESVTIPAFASLGPLRMIVEWDQDLVALRRAFRTCEVQKTDQQLVRDIKYQVNNVAEVTNMG